jgi:hypothetical protein
MLNDEGSVKGKGASIMLPARGSPFAPGQTPPAAEAFPAGAETAPRDLSPEDVATMYSGPVTAEPAGAMAGTESVSFATPSPALASAPGEPEVTSSGLRADAEIPGHDLEAAQAEPGPLDSSLGADTEIPGHDGEADLAVPEAPDSGSRADLDLPGHDEAGAPAGAAAPSAEEQAALEPSSQAEPVGGEIEDTGGLPPGAQPLPGIPTIALGMAIPATTVPVGQALPGMRAFAGAQIQVSDNVGISLETYKPGAALKGKAELVSMLVPDGRLVTLWTEIDSVEAQVAATPYISHKGAVDLLDRLAAARNYLMNDRDNFEEAERLVAEAKYRLADLNRTRLLEHSEVIMVYLLIVMGCLVAGLLAVGHLGEVIVGKGTATENLAWTILLGGLGGVTGALYGLWTHVARDRDYDPDFALWYYSNPLMGLLLGGLAYILAQVGVLAISGGATVTPSPYTTWMLAFAVGFQQNLAFSLLNTILNRIIPPEEKRGVKPGETGAGAGAGSPGEAPHFPSPKK